MTTVPSHSFVSQCVSDLLDGLRDGLSHFSGTSRAAVIICLDKDSDLLVCDPQNLLAGHELKLKKLFIENSVWRNNYSQGNNSNSYDLTPEKDLQLAGLISYGGRSASVFYQMWFTEHHPDLCSTGPTERWLEHTAWRLSHDLANLQDLYTGISGSFLRSYAIHAVRDHIVDEMNLLLGWDSEVRVYPILDAILQISNTREEGAWPRGELIFVEPELVGDIGFLARFKKMDQPQLQNIKHVRKLLQAVERTENKLVSDGQNILGICSGTLPKFYVSAVFQGRHGFLQIKHNKICSFDGGSYKSSTRRAKLVHLEEAFLELKLESSVSFALFKIVESLVHHAEHQKHGCTLVIDLNKEKVEVSGQTLKQPLDLRQEDLLQLAKSLAKVDGALHIGLDLYLHGFACLLDGRVIPGENRARGARYNSALRFSAEHPGVLVVVVSSDRPVSVIQDGVEASSQCLWKPMTSSIFTINILKDVITS